MTESKSQKKRILRWLARVVLFALVLLGILLVFFTLPPGEKAIKRVVEKRLGHLLAQEVRIGKLETNLFTHLEMRNLQIYKEQSGDTILLLDLGEAKVNYRLIDLLKKPPAIRSLYLEDLLLSVRKDSSGAYNIPLSEPAEKEDSVSHAALIPFVLGKAEVRGATLRYGDDISGLTVSAYDAGLTAEHGGGQTYAFHFRADSAEGRYREIPLTTWEIGLDGRFGTDQVRLDSMAMRLPGLKFAGDVRMKSEGDSTALTGRLFLRGDPAELAQLARGYLLPMLPAIQGDVNLSAEVGGFLDHPRLGVTLDFPTLEVAEIPLRQGLIRAEWEPDLVTMNQLSVQIMKGTISGTASLTTDGLFAARASLQMENIDLAQVWRGVYGDVSPYQGKISGTLEASGRGQDPKNWDLSSDLKLSQLSYASKPVSDLSTSLSLRGGQAEIRLRQADSEIAATAALQDQKLKGEFSGRLEQLEPLAGLFDLQELSGAAEIKGTLAGELDSPEISAEIRGEKIAYQDFPVDSLTVNALYRGGEIYVSDCRFGGELDPIDTLRPPFGISGLTGKITYTGSAGGRLDSLKGDVAVNLLQLSYGGIDFDRGLIAAVLENQRLQLLSLELRGDSLLIRGTGEFDLSSAKGTGEIGLTKSAGPQTDSLDFLRPAGSLMGTFDLSNPDRMRLKLQGTQLDLEAVRFLLPQPPDIGGLIRFDLDFSGNLNQPHAQIDFDCSEPRFRSAEMDSVKGHLTFADGRLSYQPLQLYYGSHYAWAKGAVQLERRDDGSYYFSEKSLLQGQAQGQDLDVALLQPFLPQDVQISGRGSYDLSWNGTLSQPHPVGTFRLVDGKVQTQPGAPPFEQINLSCSLQDSILSLDSLSGAVRQTPFWLQAKATLRSHGEFAVQLDLSVSDLGAVTGEGTVSSDSLRFNARIREMNLTTLQPFLPELEDLSGNLNAELSASGQTADPLIEGHLEIRELSFQPAWFDSPLNRGLVKIGFSQNRIRVDTLLMRKDQGVVFVSGSLVHDKGALSSVDLKVSVDDLEINRPKELILVVKSARLGYRSQNSYHLLDGDVVLGESRMLVNFRPQSILPFAQAAQKPARELPSLLQTTKMNVRLRESRNLWVDNNLAHLRLHTELSVIGSPAQPNITGRVVVEEGYVLYLDRKFQVKQGVVDFIDPDRLNPVIDFNAQATVTSYQATEATPYVITLAITGPLDEAVVELTSDPPQDKSNILSLLTIGATREQLGGQDATGKDASLSSVLKERAQSISSQKIAGYTSRKVSSFLGLEQFTIEGNLFRFDNSWGPQLLASKKISPGVEITYITTVGHSNENSFRLDYRLSKHLSLEGQTDQQGRAGMNLKYRLQSK
jgi:autotransporter translocation and assembly factor TamB